MREHDPSKAGTWLFHAIVPSQPPRTWEGDQPLEWDPDCPVGLVVVFPIEVGEISYNSGAKPGRLHFSGKIQRFRKSNLAYKYSSNSGTDSRCVFFLCGNKILDSTYFICVRNAVPAGARLATIGAFGPTTCALLTCSQQEGA
jgi:hypothetical protein